MIVNCLHIVLNNSRKGGHFIEGIDKVILLSIQVILYLMFCNDLTLIYILLTGVVL